MFLVKQSLEVKYLTRDNTDYNNDIPEVQLNFFPHSAVNFHETKIDCEIKNNILGTYYNANIYWQSNYEIGTKDKSNQDNLEMSLRFSSTGAKESCSVSTAEGGNVVPNPINGLKEKYFDESNYIYGFKYDSNNYGNIYAEVTKTPTDIEGIHKIKYYVYNRNHTKGWDDAQIFITTFEYISINQGADTKALLETLSKDDLLLKIKLSEKIESKRIRSFAESSNNINGTWYPVEVYTITSSGEKFQLLSRSEALETLGEIVISNNIVESNKKHYGKFQLEHDYANEYYSIGSVDRRKSLYDHRYENTFYVHNEITYKDIFYHKLISDSIKLKNMDELKKSESKQEVIVKYIRI